jgi:hypothetical protein
MVRGRQPLGKVTPRGRSCARKGLLHTAGALNLFDCDRGQGRHQRLLASIPLFMQGETRFASPASAWMFHGPSLYMSNIPCLSMTMRYVDYFKDRDVGTAFVNSLVDKSCLLSPGEYWISGNELAAQSDIVTKLAQSWNPAESNPGPVPGFRSGV